MSEKTELKLSYNVPILESGMMNNDFIIQGVAINAAITSNNHKFLNEELKDSAGTLNGVPLLVDHRNEISAIKGRVIRGEFDESNSRINFKAKVVDSEVKQMIKEGMINSVSVGAIVKEIDEDTDGTLIPRGITFKELSLVAVPADPNATFTTALHEAYKTVKSWDPAPKKEDEKEPDEPLDLPEELEEKEEMMKCPECDKMVPKSKMAEHKKKHAEEKAKITVPTNEGLSLSPQGESDLLKGGTKMSEEKKTEQVQSATPIQEKAVDYSADIKAMHETIKSLKEELTAMKAPEKKEAIINEFEEREVVSGKYRIVQGLGSLRGNSFTLVRA